MKKVIFMNVWLTIVCLLFIACSDLNDTEKKIAGKYHFTVTEEEEATEETPAMSLSAEGITNYKKDRTLKEEGALKILVELEDEEYYNVLTFECELSCGGTWSVENGLLVEKVDFSTIKFELAKATASNEDEAAEVAIKAFKQYLDVNSGVFRKEVLKGGEYKIVKITDSELVVIDHADETGEEEVYTRIN